MPQPHLPSSTRISLALSLAMLLHVVLFIMFSRHEIQIDHEEVSVRITLKEIATVARLETSEKHHSAEQEASPLTTKKTITTESVQPRKTTESKDRKETKASPEKKTTAPTEAQSVRARASKSAEDTLKTPDQLPEIDEARVDNSEQKEVTFQERLLVHAQTKGFRNLKTPSKTPKKVSAELQLHKSGQLLKVKLKQSSGDALLDRQIVNVLSQASPYPKPPEEDWEKDYTYTIKAIISSKK